MEGHIQYGKRGVGQESQVTAWRWGGMAAEQCCPCAAFVPLGFYSPSHVVVSFSIVIIGIMKLSFVSVVKLSLSQPTGFRVFFPGLLPIPVWGWAGARGEGGDQEAAGCLVATWS